MICVLCLRYQAGFSVLLSCRSEARLKRRRKSSLVVLSGRSEYDEGLPPSTITQLHQHHHHQLRASAAGRAAWRPGCDEGPPPSTITQHYHHYHHHQLRASAARRAAWRPGLWRGSTSVDHCTALPSSSSFTSPDDELCSDPSKHRSCSVENRNRKWITTLGTTGSDRPGMRRIETGNGWHTVAIRDRI